MIFYHKDNNIKHKGSSKTDDETVQTVTIIKSIFNCMSDNKVSGGQEKTSLKRNPFTVVSKINIS